MVIGIFVILSGGGKDEEIMPGTMGVVAKGDRILAMAVSGGTGGGGVGGGSTNGNGGAGGNGAIRLRSP